MRLLLTLGGSLLAGATPFAASAALQPNTLQPTAPRPTAAVHEAATAPSLATFAASQERVVAAAQDRDRREDEIDELRRMIDELRAEKDRLRNEIDAERADARPKREIVVRRVGAGDRDAEDARTRREVELEARERAERSAKELAARAEAMERLEVELRDAQDAIHSSKLPAIALQYELEALQQDLGAELDAELGELELAELDFDIVYQDADLSDPQGKVAQQRVREVHDRVIEESLRGYVESLRTHEASAAQLRALEALLAESLEEGDAADDSHDVRWFAEGDDEQFYRKVIEGARAGEHSGSGAGDAPRHVRWFAEGDDERFFRKIVEGAQDGDGASVELRFEVSGDADCPETIYECEDVAEFPGALHEIIEDADGNVEIRRRVVVRRSEDRDDRPFGVAVVREREGDAPSTRTFFGRGRDDDHRGSHDHDVHEHGHDVWVEVDGRLHRVRASEPRVESRVFFRGADGELHEIDAGPRGGVIRVESRDGGTSRFHVIPEAPRTPGAPDAPRAGSSSIFGVARPAPPSPATGGGVSRAPLVDSPGVGSPAERDEILREVHDLTRAMLGELRELRAAVDDLRRDVDARTGGGSRRGR